MRLHRILTSVLALMVGALSAPERTLGSLPALADEAPPAPPTTPVAPPAWVGKWLYKRLYYREQTLPPMNPDLRLTFEFQEDGTDRVFWRYEGEEGFCERKGSYRFEAGYLVDEITWVNPANAVGCSRDPDMQEGRKTRTPAEVRASGEFWLHLTLSGEDLSYIFDRVPAGPAP